MNSVLWLRKALEGDWTKSIPLCGPQNSPAKRALRALAAALVTAAITVFSLFVGVAPARLVPASPEHPVSHPVSQPRRLTCTITIPSHAHAPLAETQQASPPQPPSHAESSTKAGAILWGASVRTCAPPVELPILSYAAPSQSTWPGPATESDLLPTPLKVGRWRSLLASHPLPAFAVYVTLGLSKGFRIGYEGPRNILQRATNLVSATVHSAFISELLSACLAGGFAYITLVSASASTSWTTI